MKKSIFIVAAILLLGVAAVGTAQNSWIGTSWIGPGQTVSSDNLKSNLDYLYDVKAHKPQDCDGADRFLGWFNGDWTCSGQDAPTNCMFNGNTVNNGDAVTAYSASSVPFGESCVSQTRTCSNGVLSGTYQAPSCTVAPTTACVFGGLTVVHNDTVIAYENENVLFGEVCQSETRSCSNGTLSGSYEAVSCSVAPAATCVFDGNTLDDGDTVTAYESGTVSFGESCVSEDRTCSNGTLSGSYNAVSCSVSIQDPATFRQADFVVRSEREICRHIINGNTKDREAGGVCSGVMWIEAIESSYYLQGNPGITFLNPNRGLNNDGLASDNATLDALCEAKGYAHVVGHAERNRSGFRALSSPGNNSLVYGSAGPSFSVTGVTTNQTFNAPNGFVTCSNTPGNSVGSIGGIGGGLIGESLDIQQQ